MSHHRTKGKKLITAQPFCRNYTKAGIGLGSAKDGFL